MSNAIPNDSRLDDEEWTDEEWTVEGFIAECNRITDNPPAVPDGMELVECEATPRHWPIYLPHVAGQYPAHCIFCERDDIDRESRRLRCERDHRKWKSWRGWSRISGRLYSLGVTSSGGGVSMGLCEFCGITRQHMAPHWRGKRSYILGLPRQAWECLRRGHRSTMTDYGMCSTCAPCPSCASTDPNHSGDCGDEQ